MEIIYKNDGTYVDYEVSGNKITFDDELMLNLGKYERDNEVIIDICRDNKTGSLVCGVPESGKYVAQVTIPPREYEETVDETMTVAKNQESDGMMEDGISREAIAFSMAKCTLALWAM